MGRGPFGIAVVLTCVSGGCAQGDLDANTSFGMTQAGSTADDDDDDDDESADDGDTTGGSDGGSSSAGSTSASADGDTSTADSADSSSGAPVTATAEESTTAPAESSEGEPATTEAGDEMSESSDGMPMEDDGPPPMADAWESCDTLACVADAPCITVTGLRDYSPYCAPECMVDADCPDPGGTAQVVCGLVPEGETEPTQCAAFCEFDGMVLGVCPPGMSCVEVPDQMTQIAVCLWP
jgi:hypothetical protein